MKNWWKIAVVAALVIVVAIVMAGKNRGSGDTGIAAEPPAVTAQAEAGDPGQQPAKAENPAKPAVLPKSAQAPKAETVQAKAIPAKAVKKPEAKPSPKTAKRLPRLVDLGASKCIPCKMMAPILEELGREQKGKLTVVFIDVWENRDKAEKYGIKSIPTQIFYDETGKEFFRHEGFFAKDDILAKFKEQGIDLGKDN